MFMRISPFVLLLVLAGCGEPRYPIVAYDRAVLDDRLVTMRVLKVYDALEVPQPTLDTSHLIEVEILAPEDRHGERLALPYNEWMVGRQPPKAGEIVSATPAYWLRGDGSSHGKPMHGWNERK